MMTVKEARAYLGRVNRIQNQVAALRDDLNNAGDVTYPLRMTDSYLSDAFDALLDLHGSAVLAEHLASEIEVTSDSAR